jgi:hypothetical protein
MLSETCNDLDIWHACIEQEFDDVTLFNFHDFDTFHPMDPLLPAKFARWPISRVALFTPRNLVMVISMSRISWIAIHGRRVRVNLEHPGQGFAPTRCRIPLFFLLMLWWLHIFISLKARCLTDVKRRLPPMCEWLWDRNITVAGETLRSQLRTHDCWYQFLNRRRANDRNELFLSSLKMATRAIYDCPITGLEVASKLECKTIWDNKFIHRLMRYY